MQASLSQRPDPGECYFFIPNYNPTLNSFDNSRPVDPRMQSQRYDNRPKSDQLATPGFVQCTVPDENHRNATNCDVNSNHASKIERLEKYVKELEKHQEFLRTKFASEKSKLASLEKEEASLKSLSTELERKLNNFHTKFAGSEMYRKHGYNMSKWKEHQSNLKVKLETCKSELRDVTRQITQRVTSHNLNTNSSGTTASSTQIQRPQAPAPAQAPTQVQAQRSNTNAVNSVTAGNFRGNCVRFPPPTGQCSRPPTARINIVVQNQSNLTSIPLPVITNTTKIIEEHVKFGDFPLKFRVVSVLYKASRCVIPPEVPLNIIFDLRTHKINADSRVYFRASKVNGDETFSSYEPLNDNIPRTVDVKVNGQIPSMLKKPKRNTPNSEQPVEHPVDISDLCSQERVNEIVLKQDGEGSVYLVVGVYFVSVLSVTEALNMVKGRNNERKKDAVISSIRKIYENDSEMDAGALQVDLTCPLSRQRIKIPCVGNNCDHPQCFDLESFLRTNRKYFLWNCPICFKRIKQRELMCDGLLGEIISKTSSSCCKVEFNEKGEWKPVDNEVIQAKKARVEDIIDID